MQLKWKSPGYSTPPKDIREFSGTLHKQPEGVVGFFVSNVRFSAGAIIEAKNSKRKIILCSEKDLITNIKLALEECNNDSENSSIVEDLDIENIVFETKNSINIFGINITGNCKINSLTAKRITCKYRYNPYNNK